MSNASGGRRLILHYGPMIQSHGFLHGLDDANGADYCHVWVSSDMAANPINAEYLFLLHGSAPAQWTGFTRCFCLFDGKSDAQLQQARNHWKVWQELDNNLWLLRSECGRGMG